MHKKGVGTEYIVHSLFCKFFFIVNRKVRFLLKSYKFTNLKVVCKQEDKRKT